MKGKYRDPDRINQATLLWEDGWGKELGFKDLESYLETVPEIPSELRVRSKRFPYLVLVEGRLNIRAACYLVFMPSVPDYDSITPFDTSRTKTGIRWMRCQTGRRHQGRAVRESLALFKSDEVGLDLIEGLALYSQFPRLFRGHHVLLPNTVSTKPSKSPGCLGIRDGTLQFGFSYGDAGKPDFGSASRLDG